MAQQKSEDRVVPEGGVMPVPTRRVEPRGGGKAVPVSQQARQLQLPLATAENPAGSVGGAEVGLPTPAPFAVPKASVTTEKSAPATMMEEVTERLTEALRAVAANKGAPGPDGMTISEVQARWDGILPELRRSLLTGDFRPGLIRRVFIPKPGGQRGLGIPNVVDRVVQEAVRQVLEPLYEPTFHPSSHGFRPGRSCHTAIHEAVEYLRNGYEAVVDLDLEKFFDRVHHQRLLARLAQRIGDQRLLKLIQRMLKAKVVLPDGVKVSTDEGVPQGGPLSPLLSNIVLDEFDRELAQRGHRFVRYADDVNIFVRSERAGQRVMASVTRFIERRLRLKVNASKSAVAQPETRHFLGFSLRVDPLEGDVEIELSERTISRAGQRIRELTPRNWGGTLKSCIAQVNVYLRGWYGFFGICTGRAEYTLQGLDAHIRRRLRAIVLKHWKRRRTIARRLIRLGVSWKTAWRRVYEGRKSIWALSAIAAVHRGLRNAYFAERGLVALADLYRQAQAIDVPAQLPLGLGMR